MFDLSWIELIFCAVLTLVVVGPKDMPKMLKMFANGVRRIRKYYSDIQSGMRKLEQEVDLVSRENGSAQSWQDYLPENVQRLPDDFIPGQMSREQHQEIRDRYQQQVNQAKSQFEENGSKKNDGQ